MNDLGQLVGRFLHHFGRRPLPLWITIAPFALLVLLPRPSVQDRILAAGVIFQLVGLATVIIGLRRVRRTYDPTGGTLARVRGWVRATPAVFRFRRGQIRGAAGVNLGVGVNAVLTSVSPPAPRWPLTDWLAALEWELKQLRERQAADVVRLTDDVAAIRGDLARERSKRAEDTQAVRAAVQEYAVGVGFTWQYFGVAWLILGAILTAIPALPSGPAAPLPSPEAIGRFLHVL